MNADTIIGSGALWLAVPIAMLAGLVSFLSPCVLPLVPGYLGFLGGTVSPSSKGDATNAAAPERRRLVFGVLLFILGFSVVFVLITALGGTAGVFFLHWGDLVTRILGLVVCLLYTSPSPRDS